MTDTPTFATCSYIEFEPAYGIPVRSTVGHPRWKLRYQLAAKWPAAAPERGFLNAPESDFREQYRAKLDRTGPDGFRAAAEQLRADVDQPDAPVVLLCFDKLWLPDTFCHRAMFADWWLAQTGEYVPELGRTSAPTPSTA